MKMKDLSESVNKFLDFNEYKILENKGEISFNDAKTKAFIEYDLFNKTQKFTSDFDKLIKEQNLIQSSHLRND